MLSNKLPLFICFIYLLFYLSAINGSSDGENYNRNFYKKFGYFSIMQWKVRKFYPHVIIIFEVRPIMLFFLILNSAHDKESG